MSDEPSSNEEEQKHDVDQESDENLRPGAFAGFFNMMRRSAQQTSSG